MKRSHQQKENYLDTLKPLNASRLRQIFAGSGIGALPLNHPHHIIAAAIDELLNTIAALESGDGDAAIRACRAAWLRICLYHHM